MERDIVVVGNNLTSLILAYEIINANSNLNISYFYNEKLIRNSLFLPSFVYPIFSYRPEKIEQILTTSLEFYNDLFYTTKSFDISKASLLILNSSLRETEEMYNKLQNSNMDCSILKQKEIKQTLPLLNSEKYNKGLISDSSLVINNLGGLTAYILDELKKLKVELIEYKREEVSYNQKNKEFLFKGKKVGFKEFLILTDHTIFPGRNKLINVLAAKTPLVEKFPRINLIDNTTKLYINMETEGYLNLFQLTSKSEKENSLQQLTENFSKLFSTIQDFKILDHYFVQTVEKPYFNLNEKTLEIYSPFHMELNLLPLLIKELIPQIQKGKIEKKEF
ncbi:MAG: hypothetical protein ACTSWZ_01725 [Candidatus Heimdallarchaeaceae archaeon]